MEMEQYKPPTNKLPFEKDKKYHVFLSFRGPDLRKTLVDHLYQALSAAGLYVFLDSDKLEKGEIIGLSLEKAIESSVIRIPIFSKGYADSVWCLKEATAMLSTPGKIIPLFYHVQPTDIRHPLNESSPYKQSFLNHFSKDRHSMEDIERWKDALGKICSLSGWTTDITGGYEGRLVKTVVIDIIKTLDNVPLQVAKYPVGIDNVKNVLVQELNLNSADEVLKVGILGIAGIGKTTVAKAVYNQVYSHFNAASFVFNVRATGSDEIGCRKLQRKILGDLCKFKVKVGSVAEGISLFRERLRGKSVLLILDDVDNIEQLNALVGDWLAPGSRIIITSRDRHILNVAGISSECIHKMCGMEMNEGLQLFSWHAFLRKSPIPSRENLSKGIVEACKGHPLSLEVIGSYLYDKQDDEDCWKEALDNSTCQKSVYDAFKISYNALTDKEKEIFVDIACFFTGEDKTLPIVFWKSLYSMVEGAVHNLRMKLLIEIDDKDIFHMHDHLRTMGRTIAEKEERHIQLSETAHLNPLSNNNLSRLQLSGGNLQSLEVLNRPGLLYLHLQNICIECTTEDTLALIPKSLIWLRLEHCHINIEMSRAVKKQRQSRFEGNIWQMKIMQLKDCIDVDSLFISSLFSLPNHLSKLQHLDLRRCKSLISLPDTICNLSQLQQLDLGCCDRLHNLPDNIGNLSQLRHLNISECRSLKNLPNTIGDMSQLQNLDLEWCESLENLPNTIGNLPHLQHLKLRGCKRLRILPPSILDLNFSF